MRENDLDYEIIFIIWAAMGSFIIFSLKLCCQKMTKDETKTEEIIVADAPIAVQKTSPLVLFKDVKFYVIWVAHSVFVLRLGKTFIISIIFKCRKSEFE